MKSLTLCLLSLIAVFTVCGGDIILPAPQKSGGMALSEALNLRHSVRKYTADAVPMQVLANVLWSANGITRPDGKRTAPSAMNRQDIILYVALESGAYRFIPEKNQLQLIVKDDLRRAAGRYPAPCYIILVSDSRKQPDRMYGAIDAGYVSQNIYLAATAQQFGTCAVGSIADRKLLTEKLGLGKNHLLLSHPLGREAK